MKRKNIYTRATAPMRYLEMLDKIYKGNKCTSEMLKTYGVARQTGKVLEAMGILDNKRKWLTLETPSMDMVEKIIHHNNEYHKRYLEVKEGESQVVENVFDTQSIIDAFKALPQDLKNEVLGKIIKFEIAYL